MNKKIYPIFFLMLLVSLTFVSAQGFKLDNTESIGTFKVNTEVQLTNFCSTANCTYANLTQIIYPNGTIQNMNDEMTKEGNTFNYSYTPTELGEYYFITCSNPNGIANCDKDSFKVTPSGDYGTENSKDKIIINIILIIFFFILIFLLYFTEKNINYDRWYSNMQKKYQTRNFIKFSGAAIFYNLMKNAYVLYYLLGLIIFSMITNLSYVYDIINFNLMRTLLTIYTWGSLLVAIFLFSNVQEWIIKWKEDIEKIKWGMQ